MSEFVPTTEEVRDAYVVGMEHDCYYEGDAKLTPDGVYEANRFNAWLAEEKAKTLEEAAVLAEGVECIVLDPTMEKVGKNVGLSIAVGLRARAAEYREGSET